MQSGNKESFLNISAKSENVNIEEILDDVISHTKN